MHAVVFHLTMGGRVALMNESAMSDSASGVPFYSVGRQVMLSGYILGVLDLTLLSSSSLTQPDAGAKTIQEIFFEE